MRPEADVYSYVQDLEKHLQMTLFGGMADPEGAVLLVRGALADGDQARAVALAKQTQRLAAMTPGDPDMAAAADRARGLVERDPAARSGPPGATRPGWPGPARWRTPGTLGPGGAIRNGPRPCSARLRPVRRARRHRRPGAGPVQPAGRRHPAPALESRGPPGLRLGQPHRHRAARHRPGGAGSATGWRTGYSEHAHPRVPPCSTSSEARHHLPGQPAAGAPDRLCADAARRWPWRRSPGAAAGFHGAPFDRPAFPFSDQPVSALAGQVAVRLL